MLSRERFFDVSADLLNPVYQGVYDGKKYHDPDLDNVLSRAWESKVKTIIVPGKNLAHSAEALNLAKTHKNIFCSVGCSPTNCNEFNTLGKLSVIEKMSSMIKNNPYKILAVGECGLDFDNLDKCDQITQIKYFQLQMELSKIFKLPLMIRCRNAYDDLIKILGSDYDFLKGGVVLGFDGTEDQARRLQRLHFLIGISGCSLRTKEQRDVVKDIPTQSLMFMTDSPDCEVNNADYGKSKYLKSTFSTELKSQWCPDKSVKSRNEPANIVQILEVAAAVRNESLDMIAYLTNKRCKQLFFSKYKSYNVK